MTTTHTRPLAARAGPLRSVPQRAPVERRPANPLGAIHARLGNRATGLLLQAKLRVGPPDDRYEREADSVADAVVQSARAEPDIAAAGAEPVLQRCSCGGSCASCAAHKDEEKLLQRRAISALPIAAIQRESTDSCAVKDEAAEAGETKEESQEKEATGEGEVPPTEEQEVKFEESDTTEGAEPPPESTKVQPKRAAAAAAAPDDVESRIDATRARGTPLPHATRELMESRFGYDFSRVRVHTDQAAHGLNRDLNSLAFTTGRDIYFAPGQFQPGTDSGHHLLAHELTHVVQQAGGGGGGNGTVREKADPTTIARASKAEKKGYYRYTVSGAFVHHVLERILRGANSQLVTEAAIPGANRFSPALNKVGVADLYKSTPALTVAGVKGYRGVDKIDDVVSMDNQASVGTNPPVTYSPTIGGVTGAKSIAGNFPSEVLLGEIKPLSASKIAAGFFQLDSYARGYKAFVDKIAKIRGAASGSIGVGRLSLSIPDRLNFDLWSSQHTTPSPDTTFGGRRLWIAALGSGVFAYFDVASGYTGPPPAWYNDQLTQMRKVRSALGPDKDQKADKLAPLAQGKFLPGGPRLARREKARDARPRLVQRSPTHPPGYWADKAKDWEKMRSGWGKDFRRTLNSQYKEYRDKARIEKRLGWSTRSAPAPERQEAKEYGQLMFWSGLPGRFLGKVRFLLGSVWDKIIAVFDKMKEKFHGLRTKVKATDEEGFGSFSWQKTLIKILVKTAKVVAIKFITESFNFFVDCFHSAIEKVVAKFQAELTEKFAEELCQVRQFFEESKATLENEWGISFSKIAEMVTLIQDAKRWVDIAMGLINLIRLGVEAISCLTPPALGCLWGLVAQIGISEGLDLLIGTQWFDDHIVTPTIRDLVRTYATPLYQKLINRALGEKLKEYHCHIADEQFPQLAYAGASGGIAGADLIAKRDAWEAKHQDQMLKDLQQVFGGKKGKAPTKEELQQLAGLLKKLRDGGKKDEEIKAMLLAARDPASGKIDAAQAKTNLESGEAPKAAEKERKIDYPKATRSNRMLQKSLGWDPFTFYKKPGVAADSEEFADAVYDLQQALHVDADGILGDRTLTAFYDRNKLKPDQSYRDAKKIQEERQAAKEKAAAEKAAKEKAPKGTVTIVNEEPDYLIAIPVGKPAPGAPLVTGDYIASEPGFVSIPFGAVKPALTGSETPGAMLTLDVRFWIDRRWVWFTNIPVTYDAISSLNVENIVIVKVADDYYFKLTAASPTTYVFEKGTKAIYLD